MDRDVDPTLQNILNNAGNEYSSSSFFNQTAERPRSGLSQRGFSARAQNEYPQNNEQHRPLMTESAALDDFGMSFILDSSNFVVKCNSLHTSHYQKLTMSEIQDRSLLGIDQGSRQQQAEQGRARLSFAPRGLNYDTSTYSSSNPAFGMQAIHSRPQRQPIVSSQRPPRPPKLLEAGFPEPTAIFHGTSRISQLQPTLQQATPPFGLGMLTPF